MSDPVLALCGPTAAGKTEIALTIAARLGAEVVCCDSMQVYRHMDIGTAKPDARDRLRVLHHCLDVVDPDVEFSAADYRVHARHAIEDIHSRGKIPLMVGGTGLYLRAAIDEGEFPPPADPGMRERVEAMPLPDLVRELERLAPHRLGTVDLANPRRVQRAVEQATAGWEPDPVWLRRQSRWPVHIAVIAPADRKTLHDRIRRRVIKMIELGWLEEAEYLVGRYPRLSRTARKAIGYSELIDLLATTVEGVAPRRTFSAGIVDATVERIVVRTRRYARRQLTWFRAEPRAHWFLGGETEIAAGLAELFEARLERHSGARNMRES